MSREAEPAPTAASRAPARPTARPGPRRTGGGPVDLGRIRWADDTPINSDDARGRIVAAALDCVRRYGVDKTGMDDVAKAAAITRPTVYKYFGSRQELIMAVFLRVLDDQLDRGLSDFFTGAETIDQLHDGVAESMVYMLGVLRGDDAIQAILYGSRIPLEVLLREAADLLVGVLQAAIAFVLDNAIAGELAFAVLPFAVEDAAAWIIRLQYSFLIWPGADEADERAMFRRYLAPVFFRDPA
jgi:AcrR family transcriptional regulator